MKKIKPVIQSSLKDCGVSCMQWIFKYYDGYISIEKLREDTYTTEMGTSAYNIIEAFKKWNFDAVGAFNKDITSKELNFPLIAHLKLENGLEHFVVVKSIIKSTIYLMDPSIGDKKLTINEFNKLFTGYLIMAYPRSSIIKMEQGLTMSNLFFNIINEEKLLIFKIVIISLIWTFLSIISSYYLKISSNLINKGENLIKFVVIIFLIMTILKCIFSLMREYYKNHLNNLVDIYLYPSFLNHLFFLPLRSISSRTSGEIMTRIEELSNIKSLFSDIFVSCFLDLLMMVISIIILLFLNKNLSIILIIFIILYIILGLLISKLIYRKVLKGIDYQTNVNSVILENVEMLESIKHLNIMKKILKKIEYVLSKNLLYNYKFNNFFNNTNFLKNILIESCFFTINTYGIFEIINGNMNIVDLFTFNIIISYCIEPIENLINLLPKFNYIKASFAKLLEFINIKEEKLEENKENLNGDIIFQNVSYSYNQYNYVLKNVNFRIKNGMHILLNGPSGCGKSTVCKLIYQEYDNYDGDIYLDNKNIKDIDLYTIRNNITYVSQKEKLFFGTIKENILINRNIPDDVFFKVCDICKINDIVSKKNIRYDAIIEPALTNLSGGEKQRIILARGLLKNANIIILDEALSEVDKKTETEIIKNIRKYYSNKTIIYISHKNQSNCFEEVINIGDSNGLF